MLAEGKAVAAELDYQQVGVSKPQYRMTQLIQQTGGQTLTIPAAAQQTSIFEIPARPFNLARSYLQFSYTLPAPGAAGSYCASWSDFLPVFDQIQFYTRSGVNMADIQFAQMAHKTMLKYETKLDHFLHADSSTGVLFRNNALVNATAAFRPGCSNSNQTVAAPLVPPLVGRSVTASLNYTEPSYYVLGEDNKALTQYFIVPLSTFVNTAFALNKDMHLGGQLAYIRFTWAPASVTGLVQSVNADPTNINTRWAAQAVPSTVSNLSLFLAQEIEESIVAVLQEKVLSGGMTYQVPYLYSLTQNLTGTNHNMTLRFNRGHGQRLRKIFYTRTSAAPSDPSLIYSTSNQTYQDGTWNDRGSTQMQLSYFYTQLDNRRQQEINVDCKWGTAGSAIDYMLMKPRLRDTVIQNLNMHQYNWGWIEGWEDGTYDKDSQVVRSGLSLDTEKKWDIFSVYATAANINHYAFAVIEREIVVDAAGVKII